MKERKQKISQDTYSWKIRAEHGSYGKGPTFVWISENNEVIPASDDGQLGQILNPWNLNRAYQQVYRNKGSHGVDKMEVGMLKDYLQKHNSTLIQSIKTGSYRPNPVRRVEIPKEGSKTRALGIPTVVDRTIQQAIHQVLSPIYEQQFSDNSFGFRPQRSTHKALHRCKSYISEGYEYAVDMDMAKFFDRVSHSKLIEVLSRTIKDGRVVSLIHKYLNAGVMIGKSYEETHSGVPQGGPLSPLLSNIMLNELDKELEERGHKFVRYADDMVIFCKSRRAGHRIMQSIIRFIEEELYLSVNRDKTEVVPLRKIKFLGYSFYKVKEEVRFRVHPKSIDKLKSRLRELTSRSNGWGDARRKRQLSYLIKGWVNYFKYADMKRILRRMDEWLRRRLRMVIWKQWKRIRTRLRNLQKLGLPKGKAWEYANTRKGYWRISNSPILSRSITNDLLKRAGYIFLSDYYQQVRVN